MDYKTTSQALAVCVADNDAVVTWGPPGNGKTSSINLIASSYSLHLETVIASIREPSDFAGMPYHSNGVMHLAPPAWSQRIVDAANDGQAAIAYYDEISTAPPSTQAALLRPILERWVGDLKLPDSTRTIASANFPDEAADGWDLSAPVANRFVHLDWELEAKTVKQGFVHGWEVVQIPAFPRPDVMDALRKRSLSLVGIFLGTRPALVNGKMKDHTRGSDKYAAADFAFPSPRSWETVARLHAACTAAVLPGKKKLLPGVLPLLLQGTVGVSAAAEFLKFVSALDLPNIEDLLDGKVGVTFPLRGDQLEAICSGMVHSYAARPTPARWVNLGNVLTSIVKSGKADAAYSYVHDWNRLRPQGTMPTNEHISTFSKILNALDEK